jgi:two-component system CheB/CheR fusion protein
MPAGTGMTFVVVVHLDPTHESFMPELLSRSTTLKVEQARDRQPLERDHVYIVPPNRFLTLDQGLIRLQEPIDRRALRGTIDHFFRSLADAERERAIGIILSGTGTEGTLGLKAIKAENGLVIAQTPESASQPGMPASAIATGLVDLVLPPGKMAQALVNFAQHPLAPLSRPVGVAEPPPIDGLHPIVALLRSKRKHDFRGYKRGTLQRRIERRMGLHQVGNPQQYLEILRANPAEVDQLVKDLLITVTSFFRDPPAFEELAAKVLAPIVRQKEHEGPIRVWVPGCATGEEAYSIAILLAEQIELAHAHHEVQIFATDVDEDALQTARAATYPDSVALDITPQRLQRFFTHEDHRFKVVKSIRDWITFANQNIISDPPFSKLDLVSCRNLLIYLEPDVQNNVIGMFHFALKPGGCLFLGSAESIGRADQLFAPVSTQWRLYSRLGGVPRSAFHLSYLLREPVPARVPDVKVVAPEPSLTVLAEQQLLQRLGPAAVAITPSGQVLHSFGAVDRYLRLTSGAPTLDVVTLARAYLRPTLRSALRSAAKKHKEVAVDVVEVRGAKRRSHLRIIVSPVRGRHADGVTLVIFEERRALSGASVPRVSVKQRELVRMLESELKAAKEEQQSLIDQLESSNEELKAANEETVSMNEELQSTNEELVGSKEELQSLNEELTTLNGQLQEKVEELSIANDDLTNLFTATDSATVFVDGGLRVTRFTPAAGRLLNLIPTDVGRPIGHMAHNLLDFDLTREADAVLRSGVGSEKSVQGRDARYYIVRISPYQREEKVPLGMVVTFIDVTTVKSAAQALQRVNQTLEARVAERTKHLALLHSITTAISGAANWKEALRLALREVCGTDGWLGAYLHVPDTTDRNRLIPTVGHMSEESLQPFHRATLEHRFARGELLPGRVYAQGAAMWADVQEDLLQKLPVRAAAAREAGLKSAVALPVVSAGETIGVLELFSDREGPVTEEVVRLVGDIAAQLSRLLERERLMSRVADTVWREQQNVLHTVHDSLGQELTGLGMLSSGLGDQLKGRDPQIAEQLTLIRQGAERALQHVRDLSRSLFPIEIEAGGLPGGLRRLADITQSVSKIRCRVVEEGHPARIDPRAATELFRIAQEAVNNAVKHAKAREIVIRLKGEAEAMTLGVTDDGVGIGKDAPGGDGMGLHIMRYRAASIGAVLSVESGDHAGTVVTCTLRGSQQAPAEAGA